MKRISPKRRWGQNFLTDGNIARKIVAAALDTTGKPFIIEIGPGQGALSGMLLETGNPYSGIEVDPRMAELLRERFGQLEHFQLLEADVLALDLSRICEAHPGHQAVVAGNIPYNITTPILFHLFDHADALFGATLMMQKEVGARLTAPPNTKQYGLLAINTQLFAAVERIMNVPASVFYPRPRVDSVVIRLRFRKGVKSGMSDFVLFRKTLRHAFSQRRKMLRKSLSQLYAPELLAKLNVDLTRRPEQLTIPQWISLTDTIFRLLQEDRY